MSHSTSSQLEGPGVQVKRNLVPVSPIGRWAVVVAVIGLGAWVVLPLISMQFRETYPVTDTWVMPAIGVVVSDAAAVFNILAVWHWEERSVLNIVSAVLVVIAAVFFTFIVVAEGLAGV